MRVSHSLVAGSHADTFIDQLLPFVPSPWASDVGLLYPDVEDPNYKYPGEDVVTLMGLQKNTVAITYCSTYVQMTLG